MTGLKLTLSLLRQRCRQLCISSSMHLLMKVNVRYVPVHLLMYLEVACNFRDRVFRRHLWGGSCAKWMSMVFESA